MLINRARSRAKHRGLPFDINPSDLTIPKFCPVMPWIELSLDENRWTSPSIDRIDSSRGYTPDNVRIISNRANTIKSNATAEELRAVLRDAINCLTH